MKSYEERVIEDARLVILKELAVQNDGRLNEVSISHVLAAFAMRRTRDWIRTQLKRMEELGAVRVQELGTVYIATLRTAGRNHLERLAFIEGIARPSDAD